MDFDLTWLLWGLPLAFALGWAASRLDLRQWRMESRQAPKAYFRGLNHLLNEQQDQAIDAFIEAVQGDPDTAELHFALGNLFRRRGDYDRAVRVHEHLLSRADLSGKDRDRAQHALALDFLKAGLLDRAEAALQKLIVTLIRGGLVDSAHDCSEGGLAVTLAGAAIGAGVGDGAVCASALPAKGSSAAMAKARRCGRTAVGRGRDMAVAFRVGGCRGAWAALARECCITATRGAMAGSPIPAKVIAVAVRPRRRPYVQPAGVTAGR